MTTKVVTIVLVRRRREVKRKFDGKPTTDSWPCCLRSARICNFARRDSAVFMREEMLRPNFRLFAFLLATTTFAALALPSWATPYASNVTITGGTTVSFILNETSDSLKYTINGGAPVSIANTTKGTKTFNLTSPTDTFSIIAEKTAASGYSIPDGTQNTSLAVTSNQGGLSLLSDDTSPFSMYNAPRGVGVSNNPNSRDLWHRLY